MRSIWALVFGLLLRENFFLALSLRKLVLDLLLDIMAKAMIGLGVESIVS